jgi:four helix bundle protein
LEKPHKKLDLWKLGMQLVTDVYEITKTFPEQERFGLISQMRRAAVSIPSNVAEGAARKTSKEFIQYLYISQSSLSELDTQVEIAKRLGWLKEEDGKGLENAMNRMDKMLSGLIRHQKSPHALRLTPHEKMNIRPTDKGVQ